MRVYFTFGCLFYTRIFFNMYKLHTQYIIMNDYCNPAVQDMSSENCHKSHAQNCDDIHHLANC